MSTDRGELVPFMVGAVELVPVTVSVRAWRALVIGAHSAGGISVQNLVVGVIGSSPRVYRRMSTYGLTIETRNRSSVVAFGLAVQWTSSSPRLGGNRTPSAG